jgi:hypothetical protein
MLQDGQGAEAPLSALLHPGAARLASRTHEVRLSALAMHSELLRAKHLSNHTKFWETEQRFDTLEIHAYGSLLLVVFFWRGLSRIFARNPVLVNKRLSAPYYRTQTLASMMAKSPKIQSAFGNHSGNILRREFLTLHANL